MPGVDTSQLQSYKDILPKPYCNTRQQRSGSVVLKSQWFGHTVNKGDIMKTVYDDLLVEVTVRPLPHTSNEDLNERWKRLIKDTNKRIKREIIGLHVNVGSSDKKSEK